MDIQWSVSSVLAANSNKLFEPFDISRYRQAIKAYDEMPPEEKRNYRGREHYVSQTSGIELSPLNNGYRRIVEEMEARFSNPLDYEPLLIDTVFQKDLIINLLSSIENENYIKEIYRSKKRRLQVDSIQRIRLYYWIVYDKAVVCFKLGKRQNCLRNHLYIFMRHQLMRML